MPVDFWWGKTKNEGLNHLKMDAGDHRFVGERTEGFVTSRVATEYLAYTFWGTEAPEVQRQTLSNCWRVVPFWERSVS